MADSCMRMDLFVLLPHGMMLGLAHDWEHELELLLFLAYSFFERELIWSGGYGRMQGYGRCVVHVHVRVRVRMCMRMCMHVRGRVHRI